MIKLLLLALLFLNCQQLSENASTEKTIVTKDYSNYIKEAKTFCTAKGYNTNYFILIDYSIHSGKNRFFLFNFKTNKVDHECLVTHGCGLETDENYEDKEQPRFSNEIDSHCTSLGKYVVKERGVSTWGIKVKYLIQGLNTTNSNAMKRNVVFHSWGAIPEREIYPTSNVRSWGCPAISDKNMLYFDTLMQKEKNMLIWSVY